MAKQRKSNSTNQNAGGSDFASDDASDLGALLSPVSPPTAALRSTFNPDPASEINDGRFYNPSRSPGNRPSQTSKVTVRDRQPSRRQISKALKIHSQTKAVIAFENPSQSSICQRRKKRREVLFALRKSGRAPSGRPRKRNWSTYVSCR